MPKTLLLADDSVTIQRVIELTFAHEDVRVVSVSDGRRAIQWMENEWPDVVLVDVEVPEVDGYAVAAHIKQSSRLKDVPVLLLAGAFEPVDDERARRAGCDGVLIKPFEPQQLVSRVHALFAQRAGAETPGSTPARGEAGRDGLRRAPDADLASVTAFPGVSPARSVLPSLHAVQAPGDADDSPEPLEAPVRPVWELGSASPIASVPANAESLPPAGAPQKVSLVNAFSALLAAEASNQPVKGAPSAAPVSEASVEDAVRRVLVRMTDDLVRRIVVETAERLIREEIEKIKSSPE